MVKIYIRFYILIVVIKQSDNRNKIVYKTYTDLNNCFKIDFVNFIFAKSYNLQKTSLSISTFQTINSLYTSIYNV